MKLKLRALDNHNVIISILMIVIGLVLVLWPGHVMTTAMTIVGIALLIGGVIAIFSWYRGRMRDVGFLTLAEGILLAVAGVIVLVAKRQLISLAPLVVGIVVLLNGIINLAQALDQRREGYARWTVSMALAVGTIVLGLLVALNPFKAMELVVVAIGAVIIYNGASNLWIESRYRKL